MRTSQSPKRVYLDYAAATPVDDVVFSTILPLFKEDFYNPSSMYLSSKEVHKSIEEGRQRISRLTGAKQTEIIFTASATESNNLAISGVMQKFPDAKVLVSSVEHPAVSEPAEKYSSSTIRVNQNGLIDLESFYDEIDDSTVLVSVIYANNETGAIQPIKKIAKKIQEVRAYRKDQGIELPIYLHTDASQAVNFIKVDVNRLGADMITISSAKIYGPKGASCLYVNSGVELLPQTLGGGQEFGLRSGTENAAAVIGLSLAFEKAQLEFKEWSRSIAQLRDGFKANLRKELGDKVKINTPINNSLPNFLNVSIDGVDGERLVMELDEHGIQVSTGSACAASRNKGSKTLAAMGLSDAELNSSIRFSLGRFTTKKDLDYVLSVLTGII